MSECKVVTVATRSHRSGFMGLCRSLRGSGYTGTVHLIMPEGEEWDPPAEGVEAHVLPRWYEEFWPVEQMNRDPRFLKPMALDPFMAGESVVFFDGGDYLVYQDPSTLEELLGEKDGPEMLMVRAREDKAPQPVPAYEHLAGEPTCSHGYYWSGVWACRITARVRELFRLWKAYCVWSLQYGHGDMAALNLALTDMLRAGTAPEIQHLDPRWQHLPEYGPVWWKAGTPHDDSDCSSRIFGIHGTGTAHEVYDDAYCRMMGQPPPGMELDQSGRWRPEQWDSLGDPGPLDRPSLLQLRDLHGLVGVEVGVEKGLNALRMLTELDIEKLYLVDPYEEAVGEGPGLSSTREQAISNRREAERRLAAAGSRVEWIRGTTDDLEIEEKLDFFYVDGNHTKLATRNDLENLWPRLREGGLAAGHDYDGVPSCPVPEDSRVKEAVDWFFGELKLEVQHEVDQGGQGIREDWWVWKPRT